MQTLSIFGGIVASNVRTQTQKFINILTPSPYAEFSKTLTPSPSPIKGEGNKKILNFIFAPLLPSWEKGLGDEGDIRSA